MGLIKIFALFFLLISASLFPTSLAGRVLHKSVASKEATSTTHHEEKEWWEAKRHDEVSEIHKRILKVETNDYGKYDRAPTMAKPRFKLIPN